MFAQRKLENIYCILKLPYKLKKRRRKQNIIVVKILSFLQYMLGQVIFKTFSLFQS